MEQNVFEEELKNRVSSVEGILAEFLPEETGYQKTIFEALNYSLLAGGKRLRPLIMREVYSMFGGSGPEIRFLMAAIEMIHTSSLVHDDLPCMDNDLYRRGKPTTWSKFGEDMGTLAGDALMIYAFETAAGAFSKTSNPGRVGEAIRVLASKTGIYGMIGGQTADVELTGKQMDGEQLDFIYRLKTGALLEASMMIGGILAGASEEQTARLENIARNVGMAFQIRDDILDVTSNLETLGKPVHSDERNQKITYVTLYGLAEAAEKVRELSEEAIRELDGLPVKNEFLKELIMNLITREK